MWYFREATEVIESTIDPIAWKTELARVAPKLQVSGLGCWLAPPSAPSCTVLQVKEAVSTRTWRAHFEQAQKHAQVPSSGFVLCPTGT
jgi:hypothetical protein